MLHSLRIALLHFRQVFEECFSYYNSETLNLLKEEKIDYGFKVYPFCQFTSETLQLIWEGLTSANVSGSLCKCIAAVQCIYLCYSYNSVCLQCKSFSTKSFYSFHCLVSFLYCIGGITLWYPMQLPHCVPFFLIHFLFHFPV